MKKKDKERLKEDPFINFIERVLEVLKKYKREIYIGIALVAVVLIIIVLLFLFKSSAIKTENKLYSQAISIKNSNQLSTEQKIEELTKIKAKKGISSVVNLFVSSLYFEIGDFQKSQETLNKFSTSKIKLINDEKKLLEAEVLNALNKKREALDILSQLLSDSRSEISKDFILLKMAQIQINSNQKKIAITNLKTLINDFPQSAYYQEAKSLLEECEGNS